MGGCQQIFGYSVGGTLLLLKKKIKIKILSQLSCLFASLYFLDISFGRDNDSETHVSTNKRYLPQFAAQSERCRVFVDNYE